MFELEILKEFIDRLNEKAYARILVIALGATNAINNVKVEGFAGVAMKSSIMAQAMHEIKAASSCEHAQTKK